MAGFRLSWFWFVLLAAGVVGVSAPPVASAAFPGRNGNIAFSRLKGHGSTLWRLPPGSRKARRLTRRPGTCRRAEGWSDRYPSYSPTGRQIVFLHRDNCGAGTRAEIQLIAADGSGRRRIVDLAELLQAALGEGSGVGYLWSLDVRPEFAPNGREILYSLADRYDYADRYRGTVSFVSVSDGTRTRASLPLSLFHPVWGRKGWLAGTLLRQDAMYLYRLRLNGSHRKRITHRVRSLFGDYGDLRPDWSPSGSALVFGRHWGWCPGEVRSADPNCDVGPEADFERLYLWRAGRPLRRLTGNEVEGPNSAAFSPDGRKVAFNEPRSFDVNAPDNGDIRVVRVHGGRSRRLTRGVDPTWQPLPRRAHR